MRLIQEGLAVDAGPGQVRVRAADRSEIVAFFEIRAALEELAARATVAHRDPAALAAITAAEVALEEEIAAGGDAARQQALNHTFHLALYAASGNPLLARLVEGLEQMTTRRFLQRMYEHADPLMTIRDHRVLVAALTTGDAQAAGEAARRHVEEAATYLLDLLDRGEL